MMAKGSPTSHDQFAAWRHAIFSSVAPNERSRGGSDAINLLGALAMLILTIGAVRLNTAPERWWIDTFVPPPEGLSWILSTLFFIGTFGAVGLLLAFALVHRRRDLGVDLVMAFALGLAVSLGMQFFLGTTGGRPVSGDELIVNTGFPVPVLSAVIGASIVGRPYFVRGVRRFIGVSLALAIVGGVMTGRALPLALVGSFLIGWAAACTVRLIRGRPRVAASPEAITAALTRFGLAAVTVESKPRPSTSTFGVDRVDAVDARGPLRVSVYGRDSRDAEILRTTWRWIVSRDDRATPFVGRQQQAEHEALVTASVHDTSATPTPEFVGITSTEGGRDVLVITRRTQVVPLDDRPDLRLDAVACRAIATFVCEAHRGHVALGAVDLRHFGFDDGELIFDDSIESSLNPTPSQISRDVAATLVVLALRADQVLAIDTAIEVFGRDAVIKALPYLQRPALSPSLVKEVKRSGSLLADLQIAGAAALDVEAPELVPLRRVSGTTIVLVLGTLIGGWALLGVFVNVAASISTLKGAAIQWVVITFVVAQCVFPALAVADEGSVAGSLPYGRLVILEVSNTFSGLAAGTVAVMAARIRFLQRTGYDATVAISSGVLVSMVSWMVKGGLFVIALPFAWDNFNISLEGSSSGSNSKGVELVLIAIVVLGLALTAVLVVPRYRSAAKDRLTPKYHETRDHLRALSAQPRKLIAIFGGSIAAQLIVAVALGAALNAFDTSLSLATLLVVLTIGSAVGGLSPVPGGMGVVEAGMIIALTWCGVEQSIAVSAVFVQRLFTAYLPPVWGYGALLWLRRHEYL